MYYLKTEQSIDSAHFLADYEGKCRNIHGHRWRVVVEVMSLTLQEEKQLNGMVVDFAQLKQELKEETDLFDHALILEKGSLKALTLTALKEEGFHMAEVDFRPTAERFSKYFYDRMTRRGYRVKSVAVYETPSNCASYEEETDGTV